MDRGLVAGVTTTTLGAALFGGLLLVGSLRHPRWAVESTGPVEYLAIGFAFALVCAGLVATFARVAVDGVE